MRRLIAALVLCLANISARGEECIASVYALGIRRNLEPQLPAASLSTITP